MRLPLGLLTMKAEPPESGYYKQRVWEKQSPHRNHKGNRLSLLKDFAYKRPHHDIGYDLSSYYPTSPCKPWCTPLPSAKLPAHSKEYLPATSQSSVHQQVAPSTCVVDITLAVRPDAVPKHVCKCGCVSHSPAGQIQIQPQVIARGNQATQQQSLQIVQTPTGTLQVRGLLPGELPYKVGVPP